MIYRARLLANFTILFPTTSQRLLYDIFKYQNLVDNAFHCLELVFMLQAIQISVNWHMIALCK